MSSWGVCAERMGDGADEKGGDEGLMRRRRLSGDEVRGTCGNLQKSTGQTCGTKQT